MIFFRRGGLRRRRLSFRKRPGERKKKQNGLFSAWGTKKATSAVQKTSHPRKKKVLHPIVDACYDSGSIFSSKMKWFLNYDGAPEPKIRPLFIIFFGMILTLCTLGHGILHPVSYS